MVALSLYLSNIETNVKRINEYKLGHDGSDGYCDCIGLIIGAYRLSGLKWSSTHGSNYAARSMMQNGLTKLTTSNLFLGEIVYKAKAPNEEGYKLPNKYKSSGDLNDYCHVGIVTSVKPLVITHCTSVNGGVARDTKLGKWKFGGKLIGIDYNNKEQEVIQMEEAIVTGGTLNMRSNPSTAASVVIKIPDNSTISVLEKTNSDWYKVSYNNKTGYCMSKFIQLKEDVKETITINKKELEKAYDIIGNLLGLRG